MQTHLLIIAYMASVKMAGIQTLKPYNDICDIFANYHNRTLIFKVL